MKIKYAVMMLIQCFWGILQSTLGLVLFLTGLKDRHYLYRGCIVTEWNRAANVSLGLFVFVSNRNYIEHEYGHCLQSLLLGPLYLLVIGIPSFLWCNLPVAEKYRNRKKKSYYWFYTEQSANRISYTVTKERTH